jgi:hypothetical protein
MVKRLRVEHITQDNSGPIVVQLSQVNSNNVPVKDAPKLYMHPYYLFNPVNVGDIFEVEITASSETAEVTE